MVAWFCRVVLDLVHSHTLPHESRAVTERGVIFVSGLYSAAIDQWRKRVREPFARNQPLMAALSAPAPALSNSRADLATWEHLVGSP
ncbi:hypothetical protein CMQ_3709 [Grosmannia clavigera kw1407]|uniref:Uncharacterized protein n=1 Tax=Grosmannia clavigera (strain kw1407 / UAMH 11150) TaxID=655863 RepID=F0X9Z4_GROCL|nr:uncharacterized protein CMQ_3709 [Grosmannia clavigera kw1407]EFX05640.1 hypothetical protein CMQ_3709 [Grosmannia clavigera kw1407]